VGVCRKRRREMKPIKVELYDQEVHRKLDIILAYVRSINKKEIRAMKEFDDLVAVVDAQGTVVDGLNVAVDGIIEKLNAVLAELANTVDPVQVAALTAKAQGYIDAVAAQKDELIAAVQNVPEVPVE